MNDIYRVTFQNDIVIGSALALAMFNYHYPDYIIVGFIKKVKGHNDLWTCRFKRTK